MMMIYYMASQISRANNQIQHADWPRIGPVTSHTRPGSYWTDFSLTRVHVFTLLLTKKLKPCNEINILITPFA